MKTTTYRFTSWRLLMLSLLAAITVAAFLTPAPAKADPVPSAQKTYVLPPDPAFLAIAAESKATVPVAGQMKMNFTVARPATRVDFVMVDASEVTEIFLSWQVPTGGKPQSSASAIRTVQADDASGKYTLRQVTVRFADTSTVTMRSRKFEGSSLSTDDFPAAAFTVNNPAVTLQPNVNLVPPYVRGRPETGIWAEASYGTWRGSVDRAECDWLRDGVDLEHRSRDYDLTSNDVGSMISFRTTVYSPGFLPTTVVSQALGPIIEPRRPKVLGEVSIGSILRTDFSVKEVAVPSGATPVVDHRWVGPPYISRPAGPTYRPTLADQKHGYWENYIAAEVTVSVGWEKLRVVTSERREWIRDSHWSSGFNGDGTTDILARDRSGILTMYPTGLQGGWQPPRTIGQGWSGMTSIFKTGDLDRDTRNDVVARDATGRLYLYPGDGQGGWLQQRQIGTGWNIFNTIFATTSPQEGGHSGIYGRDSNGTLWHYGSGSDGSLAYAGFPVGTGWNMFNTVFPAGDFNGDGIEDLMGRTPSGLLYSYQVDGSKIYQRSVIGVGWDVMAKVGAAGDFNADGHQDVYAIDYSGRMHMYYGNGSGGWKGSAVVGWGWGGLTAVF